MSLSEAELRLVTRVLLEQHGTKASRAVAKRADQSRATGDRDNERMWLTILLMLEERRWQHRKESRARRRLLWNLFARTRPGPIS